MRKVFVIGLRHEPGELGKVAALLAQRGLNIDSIGGIVHGDHAIVTFIPNDAEATRVLLDELDAPYEEWDALTVDAPNRPGELAKLAERLGKAGANITSILALPVGDEVHLALTFEDLDRARKALE